MNLENLTPEQKSEIREYRLYIPYEEKKDRARCKRYLRPRWNSDGKFWTVFTSLNEIKECALHYYLKEGVTETKENDETIISDAGFAMDDTAKNRNLVSRFGYDAIELI